MFWDYPGLGELCEKIFRLNIWVLDADSSPLWFFSCLQRVGDCYSSCEVDSLLEDSYFLYTLGLIRVSKAGIVQIRSNRSSCFMNFHLTRNLELSLESYGFSA